MLQGILEQPLFDPKRLQQIAEYVVRIWVSLHKRAVFSQLFGVSKLDLFREEA